jgi:hypothetical protein
MCCIDLWGFFIDPPYFGNNSAEHKTLALCIFYVLGTASPNSPTSPTPPP